MNEKKLNNNKSRVSNARNYDGKRCIYRFIKGKNKGDKCLVRSGSKHDYCSKHLKFNDKKKDNEMHIAI